MIKARDLIKKGDVFIINGDAPYDDLSICCLNLSCKLFARKKKKNQLITDDQIDKLASRLEREFLRGEKLEPVLSDNSVIIKVIWSSKYLDDITIINIKADSSCFYNLRHLYTDLLLTQRQERLLKEYGNYTLRAVLGKNEHDVELWDFELIDFKPLEVGSE